MRFFIVRHGIKQKAFGDVPLTNKGIEQAEATGTHLKEFLITAILSSPLRRAQDTAQNIAFHSKSTVTIDNRLRERANWGDIPDQTFDEFIEMWDKCTRDPNYIPPIGDSARQSGERMHSLLVDLVQSYPTESNIVLVTHGGLITDYLVQAFPDYVLNRFHPNFVEYQSNLVSECSITELRYNDGKFILDSFATIEHLYAKIDDL